MAQSAALTHLQQDTAILRIICHRHRPIFLSHIFTDMYYLHALPLREMDKLSASFFTWFAPHSREAARLASLHLYHEIHEIRKFLLRLNRRIHFLLDKHFTAGNPVAPPNPQMEMSTLTSVAQLIWVSPAPVTALCWGRGELEFSQVTQRARWPWNTRSFHCS